MNIFSSIKFKFTSGIFLLIVVITAVFSILSYQYEKKTIQERVYAQLNATADLKKEIVVNYINERINNLKIMVTSEYMRKSIFYLLDKTISETPKAAQYKIIRQRLDAFKNLYHDYLSIEVTDIKGNIMVSTEDDNHSSSGWHEHKKSIDRYIEIIKTGGAAIMQDYLNSEEGHLDFAVGIRDADGNTRAIIISSIALKNILFPTFSDYTGLGLTGETLLVKISAGGLTHINPTRHPNKNIKKAATYGKEHFKLELKAASGNEGIDEAIDYRDTRVIGAYRYIPALQWGIVVKFDIAEAFKEIEALRKRILILGIWISGIMLIATYLITSRFTSPIIELTRKVRSVANGDYSIRINSRRKDEIGDMERDFNEMVEALNNSRIEIENKQRDLEEVNYELERRVAEKTKSLSRKNTALLQALEEIRKLSYAVEQSPVSIVITDTDGNITYVNKKFCKISGYDRQELIGQNPRILKSGETSPEEYKRLWQTITSGNIWAGVFHNKKKNGELFYESAIISPIMNKDGVITHFIGIKEDITEKKKLEEMLIHTQKMEAVGQLAGGIAHDFNNILTAIIGFGSLMLMNMKEDDPNRSYLKEILAAAERATHLTQGLLTFSRKQITNPKPVSLNEIIRGIEKLLRRIIREDIELKTALTDENLPVMADSGQIEQVLINLTTNARDAMPHGGVLTISTERIRLDNEFIKIHGYGKVGEYALISVSDTGTGVDEKIRKKIFEPFFTTKELGRGTGLGLAIVYGIIKQHNGYINCYSELGKGTIFRIYMPLISPDFEKIEPAAVPELKRGSETVLLAEDDAVIRKLTRNLLEMFGYKVIEAFDGEDAIRKFVNNKDKIHILLLDVIMPKKNGKEAYEEIKKIRPDIKAIFISGYNADIINEKGILKEGINFIPKPISPHELLRKVREILDK